ncbi:caprin-2 [Aplochiton taeniatus]
MVQLASSTVFDVSHPSECKGEVKQSQGSPRSSSPKMGSPGGLSPIQLAVAASTSTYQGYETYIEDGLICLKHKIRNLDKKKLKLEQYTERLRRGETLNKDQLEAVEKYEEVVHNLTFAQELHKTLDALTEDLLRAQRKALKREQVAKLEAERRRLSGVLQTQQVLQSLQLEHVREDLLAGHNRAPLLSAPQLQSLLQLSLMLGLKRDMVLSIEDQMKRSALVYFDLIEGKDKPVAGSSYKSLNEQLRSLVECGYFDRIPLPPSKNPKEVEMPFFNRRYLPDTISLGRSQNNQAPSSQDWKAEFQAMKEQEPPDSWDIEFSEKPVTMRPWKGAAVLIPKLPVTVKKQYLDPKQRREKKSRREKVTKPAPAMDVAVEEFNSPSALPKDPILRKQHLEDMMTKIHGSFSFMQDSLLDGEACPSNSNPRLGRRESASPSALAQREPVRSLIEVFPKTLHSTPLPSRLHSMDHKAILTSNESVDMGILNLSTDDLAHEPLQLAESEPFPSPPLFRRDSISISLEDKSRPLTPVSESGQQSSCNKRVPSIPTTHQDPIFSTPPRTSPIVFAHAAFQDLHSVSKATVPLPQNRDLDYKPALGNFSAPRRVSASTQTPPEFALLQDDLVYPSEYMVGNGGQMLLSPGQSGGTVGRSGQLFYTRGMRGMARGGKRLAHSYFRSSGGFQGGNERYRGGPRSPGHVFPQAHSNNSGAVIYGTGEAGYQHSYRRGGGSGGPRHPSAGWSDSSLVSSPDRDGTFTLVDSGHGDSLSVSTVEVPITPHSHTTLLPMQLYPFTQPLRVAFTASRSSNFAPGTLDQPIVFDLLHSNMGDMFDTATGRFTCPANGAYVFLFHVLKLAINVPLYINLMRNEEVMVSAYANDGAPDHETASNHAILQLYQGDQVWLRLHRGAMYGSSWKYSTFSGFLLYQDGTA